MSRSAKIAILILVIVAILFATGVGLGLTREEEPGPADSKHVGGWVVWAKETLFPKEKWVAGHDILSSACFDSGKNLFVMPFGSTCNAIIRTSDSYIRSLKLGLTQGRKVRIVLESRGKDQFSTRIPLRAGKETPTLSIGEEGAKLSLTCEEVEPGAALAFCMTRLVGE